MRHFFGILQLILLKHWHQRAQTASTLSAEIVSILILSININNLKLFMSIDTLKMTCIGLLQIANQGPLKQPGPG
jgi:hypothetical protein